MKVLFVNFNCGWPVHFETELELMYNYILAGGEVFSLHCDGQLNRKCASCYNDSQDCIYCKRKYNYAINLIGVKTKNCFKLKTSKFPSSDFVNSCKTITEVVNSKYDGIKYTNLALNNILEAEKTSSLTIKEHRDIIKDSLDIYKLVYENFKNVYNKVKPDLICIFNGRFTEYVPVVNFCKANAINFILHERGCNKTKYNLWENMNIHEISSWFEICDKTIQGIHGNKIKKDAEMWFQNRRNGIEQSWKSFTDKQEKSKLPDTFDKTKYNIVIFNSSIWETINFPCWQPISCFSSEIEIYENLAKKYKDTNYHFYIRIHPHLGEYIGNQQYNLIKDFRKKGYDNITVIEPKSSISTYTLMESTDITIVTRGSTTGVEACFWGKPVICLGKAIYMNDDVCYLPQSFDELFKLLDGKNLTKKPKENSYKYGYTMQNFGIEYKHYQPIGLFSGKFLGINLQDDTLYVSFRKNLTSEVKRFFKRLFVSIAKRIS